MILAVQVGHAAAAQGDQRIGHAQAAQGPQGLQHLLVGFNGQAGDQGSLCLVGGDIGDQGQQLGGQGSGGGAVEHHRHALGMGVGGHQQVDLHGDLQLQHHQVVLRHALLQEGHICRGDGHVGPRHHNDAVGGLAVAHLQLHVADGGMVLPGHNHVGHIHPGLTGAGQQLLAEGVVAHLANHGHIRAKPGGLYRLIGALAAGRGLIAAAQHRFTLLRETCRADDQIHHKAAYHQNTGPVVHAAHLLKSLPGSPCQAGRGRARWAGSGTRRPRRRYRPAGADSGRPRASPAPGWSPSDPSRSKWGR